MYNRARDTLKRDVISILDERLSPKIVFHNSANAISLYEDVRYLGRHEFLREKEQELLEVAALFKNTGLTHYEDPDNYNIFENIWRTLLGVQKHVEYQRESAKIASEELPNYHFSPYEIRVINDIMLATVRGIGPKNLLGMILCDADLAYLGREDFLERAALFRQELDNLDRRSYSDREWYEREIEFFERHQYHLNTSRRLFDAGKAQNLKELRKLKRESRLPW